MDYKTIDPIIEEWVRRHGLYIYRYFRDDEVRNIPIVDDSGNPITTTTSPPVKVKLTSPEWSSQSTVSSVVKEPTSAINYSSNSGYLNWQNPNGVLTDDSTYANVPNLGVGKVSNVLAAGGFGFSIPTDASISGGLVEV